MALFILYNVVGLGYWGSSVAVYLAGAILSYFLNKSYTFRYGEFDIRSLGLFFINAIVCYLLSFGISRILLPSVCEIIVPELDFTIIEQLSLFMGLIIFPFANYFGQKFIVFRKKMNTEYSGSD